jgi:hypothetical protein
MSPRVAGTDENENILIASSILIATLWIIMKCNVYSALNINFLQFNFNFALVVLGYIKKSSVRSKRIF